MDPGDVDRRDVENAAEAVREIFPETPLQLNDHLSRRYSANVWLKREDLTPVRSYKLRGAFNFMRKAIATGEGGQTFICASAGNHAQGFAFACRHFEVPGIVFMPVTTPQQKIDKTRMFGGEYITIRLFGDIFDQCYAAAREHVEVIGGVMVPPFDDPDIIEGQATVAADSLDFDVAIVDVNLAGQASYPVAEILTRRSIPFVFVSGYGSSGLRPEWQHVASVSKPVDTRQLGEAIARAMADPAPKP